MIILDNISAFSVVISFDSQKINLSHLSFGSGPKKLRSSRIFQRTVCLEINRFLYVRIGHKGTLWC